MNAYTKLQITDRMPVLFIGHGSPTNAMETGAYSNALGQLATRITTPLAILVISAHWMTKGTWITAMDRPKTIHDFYGFPKSLFEIQYPAPGAPWLAEAVCNSIATTHIQLDRQSWGLDHGTWSILRHMYPKADIPVVQLSLDMEKTPEEHFDLGQQLMKFREQGVLLLGSGNIVHNLRLLRWELNAQPHPWAVEFDDWAKERLQIGDYKSVLFEFQRTNTGQLAVPTIEHYLPLHYILGAADKTDALKFEYEELQNGSISMRSFSLNSAIDKKGIYTSI